MGTILTPSDAHMSACRAAVAAAHACADSWHGRRGDTRDAELTAAIGCVQATREPLTAYCRRGSHTGRVVSTDPVRVLNREAGAALKRLRDMARHQRPQRSTPKPYRAWHLEKFLDSAAREANEIQQDHQAVRRQLAKGTPRTMASGAVVLTTADLNSEAAKLLVRMDRLLGQLNRNWQRYNDLYTAEVAELAAANQVHYITSEDHERLRSRVLNGRALMLAERRRIAASATQRAPDLEPLPDRKPYERWTEPEIVAAYISFRERHNRYPTKAEHHAKSRLPDYKQLRRTIGEDAMARVKELADAADESGVY